MILSHIQRGKRMNLLKTRKESGKFANLVYLRTYDHEKKEDVFELTGEAEIKDINALLNALQETIDKIKEKAATQPKDDKSLEIVFEGEELLPKRKYTKRKTAEKAKREVTTIKQPEIAKSAGKTDKTTKGSL
jgi:hypothetical protein